MHSDPEDQDRSLSDRRALLKAANSSLEAHTQAASKKAFAPNSNALITRASNPWQSDKVESNSHELADAPEPSGLFSLPSELLFNSRRTRRMIIYTFICCTLGLLVWRNWLGPRLEQEWTYKEGFLANMYGSHGFANGGEFTGTRIKDLDETLLPGGPSDSEGKRRLVFLGDVHGCVTELKALLKQIRFDSQTDHLVAVGDVISKGPDNVGVLDELISLGAESVRGNHEDRLLAMVPSAWGTGVDVQAPNPHTSSRGYAKDSALLKQLGKHHLRYLQQMPLILRIPALPQALSSMRADANAVVDEILVVHAGLVPAVPLKKQDPYAVMNMRAINSKTHLPSADANPETDKHEKRWHDVWAWYNERLFRGKSVKGFWTWDELDPHAVVDGERSQTKPQPQVVVYGHNSKAGLVLDKWSKGLDTGCVKGGRLTAMILTADGKLEINGVDCRESAT